MALIADRYLGHKLPLGYPVLDLRLGRRQEACTSEDEATDSDFCS